MMDRLTYALISAVFGAVIGVVCWLLYGLGLPVRHGHYAIDPVLRHWLIWSSGAFGAVGFVLRERAADVVGGAISVIFYAYSRSNPSPRENAEMLAGLVLMAVIIGAIWFTAPTP